MSDSEMITGNDAVVKAVRTELAPLIRTPENRDLGPIMTALNQQLTNSLPPDTAISKTDAAAIAEGMITTMRELQAKHADLDILERIDTINADFAQHVKTAIIEASATHATGYVAPTPAVLETPTPAAIETPAPAATPEPPPPPSLPPEVLALVNDTKATLTAAQTAQESCTVEGLPAALKDRATEKLHQAEGSYDGLVSHAGAQTAALAQIVTDMPHNQAKAVYPILEQADALLEVRDVRTYATHSEINRRRSALEQSIETLAADGATPQQLAAARTAYDIVTADAGTIEQRESQGYDVFRKHQGVAELYKENLTTVSAEMGVEVPAPMPKKSSMAR